jgi:transcriptional regulator with XRE-family HTH domain
VLARSQSARPPKPYGRGTGVPHPVDIHVGKRIRMRRQYLDINQGTLADALDLTFQQVQKYESGTNRVSASRLAEIAKVLGVPVWFFFEGLPAEGVSQRTEDQQRNDWLEQPETIALIRLYYAIPDDSVRREFLAMVKAVARAVPTG